MKSIGVKELRAFEIGDRRVYLVPHRLGGSTHSTAARVFITVSVNRAWVVPQQGKPEECLIVTRTA